MRLPPEKIPTEEDEKNRRLIALLPPECLLAPEPLSTVFRRAALRVYYSGFPPPIEAINSIRLPRRKNGLLHFARRNAHGYWNVYRSMPDAYDDRITVLALNLSLQGVYDCLTRHDPDGMARHTGAASHPVCLRRRFPLHFNGK